MYPVYTTRSFEWDTKNSFWSRGYLPMNIQFCPEPGKSGLENTCSSGELEFFSKLNYLEKR